MFRSMVGRSLMKLGKEVLRGLTIACAVVSLASASVGSATTSPSVAEQEISHLLEFVERSGCSFIRNGKEHSSVEAREHMAMKYDHLRKRITTAEEFIERVASGSSLTGRSYRVACSDRAPESSAIWLERELERLRRVDSDAALGVSP